jgi:hypothetical protein
LIFLRGALCGVGVIPVGWGLLSYAQSFQLFPCVCETPEEKERLWEYERYFSARYPAMHGFLREKAL